MVVTNRVFYPIPARLNIGVAIYTKMAKKTVPSAADLLIPKSVLDALPAEKKLVVKSAHQGAVRRWYHLKKLFHDVADNLIDGWVCDEEGVTPSVSPWDWEGYDMIYSEGGPQSFRASSLRVEGLFSEK